MFGCLHSPPPLPSPDVLLAVARRFTPRLSASAPTPVLLDLHGLGRTFRTPEALGAALLGAVQERGLRPHAALAWTRTAARVLACARPGLTIVPPGGEAAALAPLPLHLLELGPDRQELFRSWGLSTLGELAALPANGLSQRLGPEGPRLLRLARGEDESPLVPLPAPESFCCRLELDWPVEGLEPLTFLLARLLEPLSRTLEERGRKAAALHLELGLAGGGQHLRTLRPGAPSADPRTWRTLALLDLEAHPPGDAVVALLVRADPTPARAVQFSLFDPAQPAPEKLAEMLARLVGWEGRAGSPQLVDTHRPDAFALASFAPGPFRSISLPPARAALRRFRPPLLARVALREGAPAFVAATGVRGAVSDRAGPWLASGDWWDEYWSREEWDVALPGGVYRLFRDRVRGGWFVEAELD